MIRHNNFRRGALKTHTEITVVVGGDADYRADSFGYALSENGIRALRAPVQLSPLLQVKEINYAHYLSNLGYALFTDRWGNYYKWDPENYPSAMRRGRLPTGRTFCVPCYFNGLNAYAVYSGNYCFIITADETFTYIGDKTFYCGDSCKGRVFLRDSADPYKIVWTGESVNETEQNKGVFGSGYVNVNPKGGKVLNVVEYGENIYLVREYALSKLITTGDPRNFRVQTEAELALSEAFPDASAVCGGKLWVYTKSGVCMCDSSGVSVRKIQPEGSNYSVSGAAVYCDRFVYFNAENEEGKLILEYDTKLNTLAPFAKGFDNVFCVRDGLYAFKDGVGYRMERGADDADRVWTSRNINDSERVKTLKKLTVEGEGDVNVTVRCDGVERSLGGVGSLRVGMRGKNFTLTVTGDCAVKKLSAEWEATDGN